MFIPPLLLTVPELVLVVVVDAAEVLLLVDELTCQ
jgi:hypothetical protein